VSWDVAPTSLTKNDRHYKGIYYLSHQGIDSPEDAAVKTSEPSIFFDETTWRGIPGDSYLYVRSRKKPKSQLI
jgi:hypothetical protein